jgi:hypothetical protein
VTTGVAHAVWLDWENAGNLSTTNDWFKVVALGESAYNTHGFQTVEISIEEAQAWLLSMK